MTGRRHGSATSSALPSPADWKPDFVVPEPMKPSQSRTGFGGLFEAAQTHMRADITVCLEGLFCIKDTDGCRQTGKKDRTKALKFAFCARRAGNGATILVLDDVCTTGATVSGCVRAHRRRAAEVRGMEIARTQKASLMKNLRRVREGDDDPQQHSGPEQILALLGLCRLSPCRAGSDLGGRIRLRTVSGRMQF